MTDPELEFLLYRIINGVLYFVYDGETYRLVSPSKSIKYEGELVYRNLLNEEKYEDWIRSDRMTETMINLGLWHINTDKLIQQLESKIETLKIDLFNNRIKTKESNSIRKKIASAKKELYNFLSVKANFYTNTLEGYAESLKNEYIICSTLYKNNKRVFSNNKKNNYISYVYFNNLVNEINNYTITIDQYKKLARHQLWRAYWTASSKGNLFDKSAVDMTDEQRSLINITKMYDSVFEHPECPEDSVIEEDDMLDGWMIVQRKKNEKTKQQKYLDDQHKNASEVFIMSNSEDASRVMELNSAESMIALQERMAYIEANKDKIINENELPDIKRELKNQMR
jgi:hypothetical protein